MTRSDDQILMQGLVDGELEPDIAKALAERAKADPILKNEHDRLIALKAKLGGLQAPRVSADFLNRLERVVLRPSVDRGNWRSIAASILVTALLSSGLTYSLIGHSTGFSEADAAAASHRRSLLAASPIDVATSDSHTVKPWLDAHVGISPPAVDLSSDGFELLGGRVDVIGDRPIPALVYRHKEHLVSVLALPLKSGDVQKEAPKHLNAGGMQMIHMNENGFSFWVVSDMEWGTLDQFVADFRAKTGATAN